MIILEKQYKGWTGERISRHVFYWMSWLLFYATINSYYHENGFFVWVRVELIVMLVKLPFTYTAIYLLIPSLLIKKKFVAYILIYVSLAFLGGLAIWNLDYYIISPNVFNGQPMKYWSLKINYKALDLIYISSIPIALKLLQFHIRQEQMTLRMAEQKLSAELKLLRNQLQPHFLFNTLNNLYGMVLTHHPNASDVVLRLSDMMSYMLYECDDSRVPLAKEIKNLENYIELEKVRYGERLSISIESGGDIQDKKLPPLLFIPFVENAFKHGAGKSTQACWIRINLWVKDNQLEWIIENSREEGLAEEECSRVHSGIGLANVRKRLELLYPEKYSLEINSEETFLVQLKIDLENEMPDR